MNRGPWLVLLLAGAAFVRVIPPGQEETIAVALGRGLTLPGDCHWDGASIASSQIDSRYLCGPEKTPLSVTLELRGDDVSVELSKGTAPPGFLPALAQRVAALELAWAAPVDSKKPPVSAIAAELPGSWLLFVPRAAWVALLLALVVVLARGLRRAGLGFGAAAFVFVAALALRLAVPWGPLDFSEPERITRLWLPSFEQQGSYAALSVLFEWLLKLGFSPLTLYRFTGPLLGALTCALLVPLARAFGCSRWAALVAGLALATWPVHVRYSASANPGILAALLWVSVLLLLLLPRPAKRAEGLLRLLLLLTLVVLCVYTRPEGRFVALVLIPWLLGADLPRREKAAFVLISGLVLVPYALAYLVPQGAHPDLSIGAGALVRTLVMPGVTPFHWVLLGAAGWFLGTPPRFARASLLVTVVMVLGSTVVFGSEGNPLFGHWRYLLPLTPLFALGAALSLDALHRRWPQPALLGGALLLTLAPLGLQRSTLFRPIDLQEEFQFVLRTAPSVAAGKTVVLDAPVDGAPSQGFVHFELGPALALVLALGPGEVIATDAPGVQGMMAFERRGTRAGPPFVAYQGLTRKAAARRTVEPSALGRALHEERLTVAPAGFVIDSQCQGDPSQRIAPRFEGGSLADCPVELAWYEVN